MRYFLHPLLDEGFAPFEDVNDTACKRYGYSREEFLTLDATDISRKNDVDVHASSNFRRRLRDEGRLTFESTHIKKKRRGIPR